jgi:hypothetical protein
MFIILQSPRVFENRVLRRVFGPKWDEFDVNINFSVMAGRFYV